MMHPEHLEDEDISRFVDGNVDEEEREEFLKHFSECDSCFKAYTETLKFVEEEEHERHEKYILRFPKVLNIKSLIFVTIIREKLLVPALLVLLGKSDRKKGLHPSSKEDLPQLRKEDLPHYTYDDYVQWEGRWEIINGIPFAMPAPSKKHQRVSLKIARQLESLMESNSCTNCTTYLPIDWKIAEDTVVQPDVLVVCGDNQDEIKLTITPVLVFEILSPSTAKKDKGPKYQHYEHAGVKYYCIVDPVANTAEIFSLDHNEKKYRKMGDFFEGKITFDFDEEGCRIAFDFSKIF